MKLLFFIIILIFIVIDVHIFLTYFYFGKSLNKITFDVLLVFIWRIGSRCFILLRPGLSHHRFCSYILTEVVNKGASESIPKSSYQLMELAMWLLCVVVFKFCGKDFCSRFIYSLLI